MCPFSWMYQVLYYLEPFSEVMYHKADLLFKFEYVICARSSIFTGVCYFNHVLMQLNKVKNHTKKSFVFAHLIQILNSLPYSV